MNFYEIVFIIKHDASAAHVESVTNSYISIITNDGGDISKTEFCGLRYLAYPIKKSRRGHYILLNAICKPETVKELERKFKLDEDILRSLIVRVEKLDNNASALMKRTYKDNSPQTTPQYDGE
ncbi:MAG: 30S ribosomal protein S6 [Holosporales bacterium]|jgi:small subunit ribosomal protein S6|nr:30S ribosomal protein S6 [Holosporales bacterium]